MFSSLLSFPLALLLRYFLTYSWHSFFLFFQLPRSLQHFLFIILWLHAPLFFICLIRSLLALFYFFFLFLIGGFKPSSLSFLHDNLQPFSPIFLLSCSFLSKSNSVPFHKLPFFNTLGMIVRRSLSISHRETQMAELQRQLPSRTE